MKHPDNAKRQSPFKGLTRLLPILVACYLLILPQVIRTCGKPDMQKPGGFHFTTFLHPRFLENKKLTTAALPDTQKLKQKEWYSAVMKNVAEREYQFSKDDSSGMYTTPNRRNNLLFYYNDNGFTVEPRTTQIPVDDYNFANKKDKIKRKTLPNWKVTFEVDKKQIGKGVWSVNENNAEYKTENITVEYVNNEKGMRQNFIVQKPLSNDSANLKLNFNVKTALRKQLNNNSLRFIYPESGTVLNYDGLNVWDATGKVLDAVFEKNNNDFCIHVSTSGAKYPITIDPISSGASSVMTGNQANENLGVSVASAGDVNGDGYSDVIVGADKYQNGQTGEGAAFIYYGSSAGINVSSGVAMESNQANAGMGNAVASAGDINGDGFSDVVIGAAGYDNSALPATVNPGAFFIYYGSAGGIKTTQPVIIIGNQEQAGLGYSVACAGDVNGDGYSDVVIGANMYDGTMTDEGAIFIYPGSANGVNTTAAAMATSGMPAQSMGASVASAGDVNGDGYSDVIAGGPGNRGYAFIFHGSATGMNAAATSVVKGSQQNIFLGISVSTAGDVNGDGYSDIIVGAPLYSGTGAAFVYKGSPNGIDTATTNATILSINQPSSDMGYSVAGAGDINGDGYSDVVVGARFYSSEQPGEGAAFVYFGAATGINAGTQTKIELNQPNINLGWSVASAGDVNGDGYSDIIVGAASYNMSQQKAGAAFVYSGLATGVTTTSAFTVEAALDHVNMQNSAVGAGDINGDGYGDMIVGVPHFANEEGAMFVYYGSLTGFKNTPDAIVQSHIGYAQMGSPVAAAGDINGDGYSDVLAGAYFYQNGEYDEGAVFIFYGSATGINPEPAAILESNQPGAQMGQSIASGDINGDGYSDVITGAMTYTIGGEPPYEGAVYIFAGSANGITTTPVILKNNIVQSLMGCSVANAGDVNGDGYNDVIIGASGYDFFASGRGVFYIYYGSVSGINSLPATTVEGTIDGAKLGTTVANAGDVNGDGYGDVIVTDVRTDGQGLDGTAYIYYGSSTGINSNAPVVLQNIVGNTPNLGFAASASDVNGDGYSDIILGSYDQSAAFIYQGSATGINNTPTIMLSNGPGTALGSSVATAGDINGDGFSDIIITAPFYQNSQGTQGAAFLYYGNAAGSVAIRSDLNLYNTDLTTPISKSNFGAPNFGAGLFAKSFLGRSKGKLIWETRLNYKAFSGAPITNSVTYTGQQTSYTDLGPNGRELKNLISKDGYDISAQVRARIKYDLVTAITGQVYGPWRYVSQQITGPALIPLPVNLVSFNAAWQEKGKMAKISFTTDNESSVCCYAIEKSADGVTFHQIGKLTANNLSAFYTYSFIDYNATDKKSYYRLKVIHQSGDINYSNIQLLQYDGSIEIFVFPNPATHELQLQLNNTHSNIRVQIMNSAGLTVKQFDVVPARNQTITIPVNQLASGVYFLRLQSGKETQVLQFVKQ